MRPHNHSLSPCMECPYRKDDFCSQFNKKLTVDTVETGEALGFTVSRKAYAPCTACCHEMMIEEGIEPPQLYFHRRRSK